MNAENIKITKEEKGSCELTMTVEIPQSEVQGVYDGIVRQFCRHAQLPGFRAGKAPKAMVLKSFGEKIQSQLDEEVVREGYQAAFANEDDVTPAAYPKLKSDAVDVNSDYTFTITVEIEPVIEVPDYKSINLEKKEFSVTDADVTEEMDKLCESRKKYEKADDAVASIEGDMLKVTYSSAFAEGDEPSDTERSVFKAENTWIMLSGPEMIPGTAEKLVDVKAGETVVVEVNFPEGFYVEDVVGKKATYTFEISEVHTGVIPEIDEEFAKSLGVESVEKLNESMKSHLQMGKDREEQDRLRDELVTALIGMTGDFDVPASSLKDEMDGLARNKAQQAVQSGGQFEMPTEDEMSAEAKKKLQSYYILRKIAKEEEVQVSEEELTQQIEMMAMYSQKDPKVMMKELQKDGRVQGLAMDIAMSKTMAKLVAIATGEESETAEEEVAEEVTAD